MLQGAMEMSYLDSSFNGIVIKVAFAVLRWLAQHHIHKVLTLLLSGFGRRPCFLHLQKLLEKLVDLSLHLLHVVDVAGSVGDPLEPGDEVTHNHCGRHLEEGEDERLEAVSLHLPCDISSKEPAKKTMKLKSEQDENHLR